MPNYQYCSKCKSPFNAFAGDSVCPKCTRIETHNKAFAAGKTTIPIGPNDSIPAPILPSELTPAPAPQTEPGRTNYPLPSWMSQGMSLRDWFAGMAMCGMLTSREGYYFEREELANYAYKTADEMLARREK